MMQSLIIFSVEYQSLVVLIKLEDVASLGYWE
jgi:hypothetical protein